MKLYLTLITIITAFFFTDTKVQAQSRQDSIKRSQKVLTFEEHKQRQHHYYRRLLNIDSAKAVEVSQVQDTYKAGMKVLEGQNLSLEERRARIKALMEEKNKKFRALLTPEQQEKIIPPGEREPGKKAKENKN